MYVKKSLMIKLYMNTLLQYAYIYIFDKACI